MGQTEYNTLHSVNLNSGVAITDKGIYSMRGERMFLSADATDEKKSEYDAALARSRAENDMLLAAERFLVAHGYTVTFDHGR